MINQQGNYSINCVSSTVCPQARMDELINFIFLMAETRPHIVCLTKLLIHKRYNKYISTERNCTTTLTLSHFWTRLHYKKKNKNKILCGATLCGSANKSLQIMTKYSDFMMNNVNTGSEIIHSSCTNYTQYLEITIYKQFKYK